ncbi:MAG: hypothetical protein EOP56_02335 [Sphingobacteriales bacterium]|nr:MAG: hypothetical protein EOP56_02335 [Sphingobacteriales bacterium]
MSYKGVEYREANRDGEATTTQLNLTYLKNAIDTYTHEIREGKLDTCVAWSNRGLCKLNLGIANKDRATIESAIEDFHTALKECTNPGEACETSRNSLVLAEQAINTIFRQQHS